MKKFVITTITSVVLAGCAGSTGNKDPYPGTGGLFMGTPAAADIKSGRSVYDAGKFTSFKVGVTTKRDVVDRLGKPAWWDSKGNSSSLGYDYVRPDSFMGMSKIERATFTFNADMILTKMDYPDIDKAAQGGPNVAAYEAKMTAFIEAAKKQDDKKMLELTSPTTRKQQGDIALTALYLNDTIPLFSRFKLSQNTPAKYTRDDMGNEGFIFNVLLTNEKGQSAPLFIAVLRENGGIYVSGYGLAQQKK